MEKSKSAIIFGGSRGIGFTVAKKFAQEGFSLSISSRSSDELTEATQGLNQAMAIQVLGQIADIINYDAVKDLFQKHIAYYGAVDTVVNAAAIQGPIGPLWKNDPQLWSRTVNINLVGCFNVCKAALELMIKQDNGSIILFSGGGAAYARPNFSAYGASKTGVLRLAETLSCELKDSNVNVYAIAPGAVKTKMTKEVLVSREQAGENAFHEAKQVNEGKGTSPDKAAELCIFLATKRPRNLCGRLIHVNEPYEHYCLLNKNECKVDRGLLRRVAFK